MSIHKAQNPILLIAAVILVLGFVIVGSGQPVLVQGASNNSRKPNEKPLADFVATLKNKVESREVSLWTKFSADYQIVTETDGDLDTKKSGLLRSSGDVKLKDLAVLGILALSQSEYFGYLRSLGAESYMVSLSQDGEKSSLIFVCDYKTKERARTHASALSTMAQFGKIQAKRADEKLFFESTNVSSDGNSAIVTISLPTSKFEKLILGSPIDE